MTSTTIRRAALAVTAAAALAFPTASSPAQAAEDPGFSAMDDYVRVLVYWHRNPTWGLGDDAAAYNPSEDYARSLELRATTGQW